MSGEKLIEIIQIPHRYQDAIRESRSGGLPFIIPVVTKVSLLKRNVERYPVMRFGSRVNICFGFLCRIAVGRNFKHHLIDFSRALSYQFPRKTDHAALRQKRGERKV